MVQSYLVISEFLIKQNLYFVTCFFLLYILYNNYKLQKFPREVKDGIWKKILVDKFCSNTGEVMRIFDNIILLEMGTWDAEADSPLSNKSINTRVYRCLHRDLQDKILMFGISIDKIFSESPRNLIKKIVEIINFLKKQSNVYDEKDKECQNCKSIIHATWNCPIRRKSNDLNYTKIKARRVLGWNTTPQEKRIRLIHQHEGKEYAPNRKNTKSSEKKLKTKNYPEKIRKLLQLKKEVAIDTCAGINITPDIDLIEAYVPLTTTPSFYGVGEGNKIFDQVPRCF